VVQLQRRKSWQSAKWREVIDKCRQALNGLIDIELATVSPTSTPGLLQQGMEFAFWVSKPLQRAPCRQGKGLVAQWVACRRAYRYLVEKEPGFCHADRHDAHDGRGKRRACERYLGHRAAYLLGTLGTAHPFSISMHKQGDHSRRH